MRFRDKLDLENKWSQAKKKKNWDIIVKRLRRENQILTPGETLKAAIISSIPEKQSRFEVEETVKDTTEGNNTEIETVLLILLKLLRTSLNCLV